MTLPRSLASLALLWALWACSSEPPGGGDPSAGETWSVDPEPVVVIGEVEGESEYLFEGLGDVRLVEGDRVVVVDSRGSTVGVYGLDGRWLGALGREGEGPGGYAYPAGIWLSEPDTVHVVDRHLRRVTSFLLDGSVTGTRSLQVEEGWPDWFIGAYRDGSVIVGWLEYPPVGEPIAADVVRRASWAPDGDYLGALPSEPGAWRWAGHGPVVRVPHAATHPLSPSPHAQVRLDTLHVLDAVASAVILKDRSGDPIRSIPLPESGVDIVDAWFGLEHALEARGDTPRFQDVPPVDSIPQVATFLVDDRGRIWAKRFDPGADAYPLGPRNWANPAGGDWWVVDRDGTLVATVTLPDEFNPKDIRGPLMAGVTRDELDVERVVVLRLRNRS